jgi:hypothetical protein
MGRLPGIFNEIIAKILPLFWRPLPSRPEDIPKKLDAGTLHLAMQEARFLHSQHAVDVRALKAGELPALPRRADEP